MDSACNKLFAGSGFASYEDRRIAWRDFGDTREDAFQSRRCSNDLFKHRGFVDFFTQSDVLLSQSLLSLLAILDVSSCAIPSYDVPSFIFDRNSAEKKPQELAGGRPQPNFKLMRRSLEKPVLSFSKIEITIIWMNELSSRPFVAPLVD